MPTRFTRSCAAWRNRRGSCLGEKAVIGSADFKLFREGLDPIIGAGKLGCLLAQFPPSFKAGDASIENLERYLVQFRDCPLAVELRHKSWSERAEELKGIFASLDVAWAFIDEPRFLSSIEQRLEPAGSTLYVRFHGRNAAKRWKHDEAWERYDHLYVGQELLPFSAEFRRLIEKAFWRVTLPHRLEVPPRRKRKGGCRFKQLPHIPFCVVAPAPVPQGKRLGPVAESFNPPLCGSPGSRSKASGRPSKDSSPHGWRPKTPGLMTMNPNPNTHTQCNSALVRLLDRTPQIT